MSRTVRDPELRDAVIDAARRTIAAVGLQGATVRSIAAEGAMSTGSITHYFDDKAALLRAALDRTNVLAATRVAEAASGLAGIAAIHAAIDSLLPVDDTRRLEWRVWFAFWTDSQSNDSSMSGLLSALRALHAIFEVPFAEAITMGELPDGLDVAYEIDRVITLIAGVGLVAATSPTAGFGDLARRIIDDHVTMLRSEVNR